MVLREGANTNRATHSNGILVYRTLAAATLVVAARRAGEADTALRQSSPADASAANIAQSVLFIILQL